MILKRLLLLTANNQKVITSRPLYTFGKKKKQPQPQPQENIEVQENVEAQATQSEPIAQNQQSAQNVVAQGFQAEPRTHKKRFHKFERRSRPRHDESENDDDKLIVNEFLRYKRPTIDFKQLLEIGQQIKDPSKLQQKFQQMIVIMQEQKQKPILEYEKKLNLTPELIASRCILRGEPRFSQITQEEQIELLTQQQSAYIQVLNDSLTALSMSDVKKLYKEKFYSRIVTKYFLEEIFKVVSNDHSRNFLLNTLYEHVGNRDVRQELIQISNVELSKALDLVSSMEYNEVNPIKFYWCAFKMNGALKANNITLAIKEFNKIRINSLKAERELKSLSYFYLGEEVSSKIMSHIIKISDSLKEAIDLWLLTMITVSKIKKISEKDELPKKINFNDVFHLTKSKNTFNQFFANKLPQILQESAPVNIFNIYLKALKYSSQNSKDESNIEAGDFQAQFGISLHPKDRIQLEYIFDKDPNKLKFNLFESKDKTKIYFNFPEFGLVQSIVKGQYSKALEYFTTNVSENIGFQEKVDQYMLEARNLDLDDANSRALYVLKEVFKESKFYVSTEDHRLTESKLKQALSEHLKEELENQSEQGQQQDNISFKEGRPSGSFNRNNRSFNRPERPEDTQGENINVQSAESVEKSGDNRKQFIRERPPKSKGLFSKKGTNPFSTIKDKYNEQQKPSKEQTDLQYENYLRTVKETQTKVEKPAQAIQAEIFDFSNCKTVEEVESQFKKHLSEINESNLAGIIANYQNVPVIGNINVLFKYTFLNMTINEVVPKGLVAEFSSSFGDVSKNYGQYLKGCIFNFALIDQLYLDLLLDQSKSIQRHKFKKIVAHILYYKKEISDPIIGKICEICSKEKIGLTLLQIINLINIKGINISYDALKVIAASIQNFKNMQSDLLQFLKKYCERNNLQIQTKLFEPYIVNLVTTENYEALNNFFDVLRQQLKPKEYIIDPKLTPDQNLVNEKAYKQKQNEKVNKQLFEMVKIAAHAFKPRTIIPAFLPEIYELFASKKTTPMTAQQYGIGLIIHSQNEDKFLDLIKKVKANPNENNEVVLESIIRSLLLFGRNLKGQIERILAATLYQKQFDLNQTQLKNFGFIFKDIDTPGAYSQYLQYILKKQPKHNPQIRSLYYKIFNMTTDDHSKNQLSSLLDFIFNPTRQKERIQYKKVKEEEERKAKILQSLGIGSSSAAQEKKTETKQEVKTEQKTEKLSVKQKKEKKKQKKQSKKAEQASTQQKTQAKQGKQQKKQVKAAVKQVKKPRSAKILSSVTYDENKRAVFNPKLSAKDLRNKSLRMFVDNFMGRFEPKSEEQIEGNDKKSKKSGKQADKKEGGKKQAAKKK